MKAAHAALAVALAAGCWCCSTAGAGRAVSVGPLEAVQPGMTAQQLEEAAGPPCMIDELGGRSRTEVWRYDGGVVILDGGRVTYRFLTAAPGT